VFAKHVYNKEPYKNYRLCLTCGEKYNKIDQVKISIGDIKCSSELSEEAC
jgi:hypothetical protein